MARSARKEGPWMNFTATWYTPAGGVGNGLTTASGLKVSEQVIAVDPSVIPLGSVIEVKYPDGRIERKLAADTGGAVKGQKIDIFCWERKEALQNGRQKIQVRIVGHTPIG
ncbi:3D domain-containing protein [Ammoniphilus sp. 3BR4]|uniref:3D domain-containing protein n=1 Tax=Ammoniphilus sp. 3BR4 TaxID=3158265 RepID=UPI0034653519